MSKKGMKRFTARFLTGVMVVGLFSGMTPEYVVEAATIDSLPNISITEPVVGATPENEVGDGSGGNIELSWTGDLNDGKFKCGVGYTVTYDVAAEQDDTFADSVGQDGSDGIKVELSDDKTKATVTITYKETPHGATEKVAPKQATCQEGGAKAVYQCSTCNKFYVDGDVTLYDDQSDAENAAKTEIDPDNHVEEKTFVAYQAATCKVPGTYAHFECECGALFAVDGAPQSKETEKGTLTAASTVVTAEDLEEDKVAHNGTEVVAPAVTADCQNAERAAVYKCASCEDYYVDGDEGTAYEDLNDAKEVATGEKDLTNHVAEKTFVAYEDSACDKTETYAHFECKCGKHFAVEGDNSTVTEKGELTADSTAQDAGTFDIAQKSHGTDVEEEATPVTCQNAGTKVINKCSTCNKFYVDGDTTILYTDKADAENAAKTEIDPDNHVAEKTFVAYEDSACDKTGTYAHFECKCGKHFAVEGDNSTVTEKGELTADSTAQDAGTFDIPKKSHTAAEVVAAADPTCTEEGTKAVYECSTCHKFYVDENTDDLYGTQAAAEAAAKIAATGHTTAKVNGQAATCTADGWKDYYHCSGCDKDFSDAAGTTEITVASWKTGDGKVAATGHAYSAPTWTWTGYTSATATFKCANCNDTKEIAATITKEETPATAEKEGKIVYTATATFNGETVTDTKEETLPKTGKTDYATVLNGVDYSAVYDFNYYVNKYPDIKKAFGNDDVAVLKHFVTYGMKEGRQASAEFNLTYYRNRYADLRAAYGNNNASYYTHYIKYGKGEKRDAKTATELVGVTKLNGVDYSPIYNYNYYVNKYPDIKKAFGNDDVAVLKHFVTYGMKEGRQASAEFNLTYYRNRYADLRAAYGNNNASYYTHYIKYGKKERRDAKTATELVGITMLNGVNYSQIYNYNYYVNKYADIKKAFGNDDVAVLKHFVTYGMKEGRQASENFNINVYKNRYADLQKAFGSDNAKYYMHYLTYGIKEGRKAK